MHNSAPVTTTPWLETYMNKYMCVFVYIYVYV